MNGKEIPQEIRKRLDQIKNEGLKEFVGCYLFEGELLRGLMGEMHSKYTIPQMEARKEETKRRQQEGAFGSEKWDRTT